jgi:hypothetical protein|tara:strand:- start:193 stop:402 length:210 start_codon:yes stop_codon:yes gene_type:complete
MKTKSSKLPQNEAMQYEPLLATVDDFKKENQIGCGYCAKEKECKIRDPKINKAKQGCKEWQHWQDPNGC